MSAPYVATYLALITVPARFMTQNDRHLLALAARGTPSPAPTPSPSPLFPSGAVQSAWYRHDQFRSVVALSTPFDLVILRSVWFICASVKFDIVFF